MNRRHAICVLGGGIIGLTGCSAQRSTGLERKSGGTPTAESSTTLERANAPRFLHYTANRVRLSLDPDWIGISASVTSERGLFVGSDVRFVVSTRRYPAGEILARGSSRPIDTEEAGPVSVSVPLSSEKEEPTGFAHHVAELRPVDAADGEPHPGLGLVVAETDRFRLDGAGDLEPAPHPKAKRALQTETFERREKEGCYQLFLTNSNVGTVSVRVFKSEYVQAAESDRPERYRPFVEAALESGLAERLATGIVREVSAGDRGNNVEENGDDNGNDPALQAAIDVVQSIPYVSEPLPEGEDEYVKFPTETLVEGGGDCEDTAVLLAAILRSAPFDRRCALIQPPNHMGVGINGESFVGTYYRREGTRYFYVETTGNGWEIGELPPEYANETALVFPV